VTLTDVHNDPRLLADFLRVPYEPTEHTERNYYNGRTTTKTLSAEDYALMAWDSYRKGLQEEWLAKHRRQTWGQFITECLREGLGIKGKGKVTDRIDYAMMARPDLYKRHNS
jgi:hypothetical protein